MDLLWSDPTTNDSVEGVQPSPRGPGLVTFGPDRVKEFCKVSLTWGRAGQGMPAACHSRAWLPCSWLYAGLLHGQSQVGAVSAARFCLTADCL